MPATTKRLIYSYRSAKMGLARATRKACAKMVAQAMAKAIAPAVRKYRGLSEIREAKLCSQWCK